MRPRTHIHTLPHTVHVYKHTHRFSKDKLESDWSEFLPSLVTAVSYPTATNNTSSVRLFNWPPVCNVVALDGIYIYWKPTNNQRFQGAMAENHNDYIHYPYFMHYMLYQAFQAICCHSLWFIYLFETFSRNFLTWISPKCISPMAFLILGVTARVFLPLNGT